MKDNMLKKFLKKNGSTLVRRSGTKSTSPRLRPTEVSSASLQRTKPGFILAFALIVTAVLLTTALAVSRVVNTQLFFTKLVENSRGAYFAADSGMECAEYIDTVLRDLSLNQSIFLNAKISGDINTDFVQNANTKVFFEGSTVRSIVDALNNVTCASDTGTENKIFTQAPDNNNAGLVSNRQAVIDNLNQEKSSYTLVGDTTHATTTFGFVIKDEKINRCVLVEFAKTRYDVVTDATINYGILATGYSNCNPNDKSRVIRTIYRFNTN